MERKHTVYYLTFICLVVFMTLISGCQNEQNNLNKSNDSETIEEININPIVTVIPEENEPPNIIVNPEEDEPPVVIETPIEDERYYEYSLEINGKLLSLHDRDYEKNFDDIWGQPLTENVIALDRGSYFKELTFDGLTVELYSGNGDFFWIMTMVATIEGFSTPRGIEVGQTLEELLDVYPEVTNKFDGRTDPNNSGYSMKIDEDNNDSYLKFEISEGIITEIRVFHLIN